MMGYDEDKVKVHDANICAQVASWLGYLAHARDVFIMLEKPTQSRLLKFPAIEVLVEATGAKSMLTYLGSFGDNHKIPKPVHLITTLPEETWGEMARRKPKLDVTKEERESCHDVSKAGWVTTGKEHRLVYVFVSASESLLHTLLPLHILHIMLLTQFLQA